MSSASVYFFESKGILPDYFSANNGGMLCLKVVFVLKHIGTFTIDLCGFVSNKLYLKVQGDLLLLYISCVLVYRV